jgi:hypothetical protein
MKIMMSNSRQFHHKMMDKGKAIYLISFGIFSGTLSNRQKSNGRSVLVELVLSINAEHEEFLGAEFFRPHSAFIE